MTTTIIIAIVCLALGIILGFYISKFIKMSNKERYKMLKEGLSLLFAEIQKQLDTENGEKAIEELHQDLIKAYPQLNEVLTKEQFSAIIKKIISQSETIIENFELEGDEK